MSTSGLTNQYNPPTLDGLTVIEADQVIIDGKNVDIDALVPYTGATQTLDMGSQSIRTTHNPVLGPDVVNLTTLTAAVLYGDTANALTYLNKITTGAQTVAGPVTYNASQTYGDKNTLLDGMKLDGGVPSTGSWEIDVTAGPTLGENPLQFKHFQTDKKVIFRSDGKIYSEALTVSKALVSDASGNIVSSGVSSIDLGFVSGVTSAIQTQLNGKAVLVGGNSFSGSQNYSDKTASSVAIFDGSKNLVSSAVTVTELNFIGGVTSGVQGQINGKLSLTGGSLSGALSMGANKVTSSAVPSVGDDLTNKTFVDGAISGAGSLYVLKTGSTVTGDLTLSNLTANRVLILDASKIIKTSSVTTTELGYVSGVTSAIQTQINTVSGSFASYLPLTGGSLTGYLGVNQASPQWKIHASNTNAWNSSTGNYASNKADGIMGLGGKDNNANYQYLIYPNPSQTDGGVAGMAWWSSDMITGRYKNEFRVAWWKETHGGGLGSAYKEGITLYLLDDGGYTNLDYIQLNGKTTVNGRLTCAGVSSTSTVEVGLASNTTASIKLANSLNHITGNASEAYLFNGQNGYIAIGRNTTRSATEANLHMGTTGADASIESIASNGSVYLPLSFYASKHYFYGNVGIGTITPAYKLSVQGDVSATGSLLFGSSGTYIAGCIYSDSTWGCIIRAKTAGTTARFLWSDVNDVYQMRISPNGVLNFHGGASAYAVPTGFSTTAGALVIGGIDRNYDDGWNAGLLLECSDTTGISIHDSGVKLASFMYYSGNRFYMGREPPSTGWGTTPITFVSVLTCDSNVGIGISPTCKLDVREGAGGATYTPVFQVRGGTGFDASNIINFQCQASQFGRNIMYMTGRYEGGNDAFTLNTPRNAIIFRTQSSLDSGYTTRWTIQNFESQLGFLNNTNGNAPTVCFNSYGVGIGTTTSNVTYNPSTLYHPLNVNGYINGLYLYSTGTIGTGSYTGFIQFVNSGHWIGNFDRGGHVMAFNSGAYFFGNLTAGTVAIDGAGYLYTYSDSRVKNTIEYFDEPSLDKVLRLKPCSFKLNQDPYNVKIGFIAQDVEEVIPDAVDGKKHEWQFEINKETGDVILDEDGQLKYKIDEITGEKIPRYRGLDTTAILAHSVKAIQELHTKQDEQQKQIDTLTQRNEVLEAHARQQEKAFTDYKKETDKKIEKLASLIGQLMSK